MRCSALLLVVALAALTLPSAAAADGSSIQVVVEIGEDGAPLLTDVRRSDRSASTTLDAVLELGAPTVRFHDHATPDGRWEGGPVRVARTAVRAYLPIDSVGRELLVRLDGGEHALLLPDPDDAPRGGEPEPEVKAFVLQQSGASAKRQDIVFLPDGYQEGQRQQFLDDADEIVAYLATVEPYARYLPFANIYALFLPSTDSGSDHLEADPQTFVDTLLGCHFGAYGIPRLLDCDEAAVLQLAGEAPGDDVRIVLVNDPAYGGSGGETFAAVSTGEEMVRVAAHEMAHSDAGLGDEYDYGYGSGGSQVQWPNCHWSSGDLPWALWIDEGAEGVDAFPVCGFSDYFRPTDESCLMNVLQDEFCVVCREAIARTIYDHLTTTILATDPADGVVPVPVELEELVTLDLTVLHPDGEPLLVIWDWVEQDIELGRGNGMDSIDLAGDAFAAGPQTIRATVQDRIGWILSDVPGAMADEVEFQVEFVSDPPDGDDDDDGDGGSGCAGGDDDDGGDGCAAGDDDDGGFNRVGLLAPLWLLRRRRRRPAPLDPAA
jgi:hypothetical protein